MRSWIVALGIVSSAWAQSSRQNPGDQTQLLKQVAFEQKLNAQLPIGLPFRDETGRTAPLGEYFQGKPVVLVPVYYECPMLCNLTMSSLVKTLKTLPLTPGKDFRVVMFSFDPREKPELAAEKKKAYLKRYERTGTDAGWSFLTGEEENIKKLTESMGFRYAFDPTIQQYAHAAGFVVATPDGRLSRYLYGIEYSARDLRLGILESSKGKIGDPVGQLLLMCFHYDPSSGKYTLQVLTALRAAGVLTLAVIGGFLIVSFRREKRQKA
ncbi:MAG: SCO family protein [Bryobacterales bacterium]|nr:SCO family protein [Bryobacterales bacterium]